MRRRSASSFRPAHLALILWIPTIGAVGWLALGTPSASPSTAGESAVPLATDIRSGIAVTHHEREVALAVMRENLESIHGILLAMERKDREEVARLADVAANSPGPARRDRGLRDKLPPEWRAMGQGVDRGFSALAEAARSPQAPLLPALNQATAACVSCHQRFRLDVVP